MWGEGTALILVIVDFAQRPAETETNVGRIQIVVVANLVIGR